MTSRILVTGASGFVGQALCAAMRARGIPFSGATRTKTSDIFPVAIVRDMHPATDWRCELKDVHAVVHLAARVHKIHDHSPDPLRDYRLANVDTTLNLAAQCAAAGVRRFVYVSSIKVNGEATTEHPFSESNIPIPSDPYGISKYEAEQELQALAQRTGLEVVVIRPPLVYGPRVKANFLQLMRWVHRGVPLPLASVANRRSLVFVGNLVDVILRCLRHEAAAGRTFLVSDDHDVTVAELVRSLASAMGKRPFMFPVSPGILQSVANFTGKGDVAARLLNSLQVNIEYTKRILEWAPPYSFDAGIEETVRHFLESEAASLHQ